MTVTRDIPSLLLYSEGLQQTSEDRLSPLLCSTRAYRILCSWTGQDQAATSIVASQRQRLFAGSLVRILLLVVRLRPGKASLSSKNSRHAIIMLYFGSDALWPNDVEPSILCSSSTFFSTSWSETRVPPKRHRISRNSIGLTAFSVWSLAKFSPVRLSPRSTPDFWR